MVQGAQQGEAVAQRRLGAARDLPIGVGETHRIGRAQPLQGDAVAFDVAGGKPGWRKAAVQVRKGVAADLVAGASQGRHLAAVGVATHRALFAGEAHGDEEGPLHAAALEDPGAGLGGAGGDVVEADGDHRPRRIGRRPAADLQTGDAAAQLALEGAVGALHQIARAVTATR